MNYQVLARKWRPRDFSTLVGQEHVVKALSHALDQNRLHHAWLFTGTRGVGKTTLSRILAKALNCIGPDGQGGVTSQPCGVCKPCTEIDSGRFVDYLEMDAASNRGVEEMASLLEKAIYGPSVGRYKVYMIDEVHMLTNHAFNAMLKTLEEPPEHVKFILATTDPQKIPVTVLSRCLQFNLKQMPPGHIVGHLEYVLGEEKIAYEANALRLLAKAAQGSMRDALSLTDQAIAYSAGSISEVAVQGMLGALDQSYLVRLCDALVAEDGAGLLAIADEMAERSLSFSAALQDLGALLHKVALAQTVPAAVQEDWPEAADVRRLATAFDAQEVQLYYQIANHGRAELALAPDEYAGFTMTLLRMLAFRPTALGQGGVASSAPSVASSTTPAHPAAAHTATAAAVPPTTSAAPTSPARAALLAAAPASASVPAPVAAAPSLSVQQTPAPFVAGGNTPRLSALEAAQRLAERAGARAMAKPAAPAQAAAPVESVPVNSAPTIAPISAQAEDSEVPPWMDMAPEEGASAPVSLAMPAPERAAAPAQMPSAPAAPEKTPAASVTARLSEVSAQLVAPEWPAFDGNWPALVPQLNLSGLAQELARQSELQKVEFDQQMPVFYLCAPVKQVTEGGAVERLQASLSEHFACPIKVTMTTGAVQLTAAAVAAEARAARQAAAEQAIAQDPLVQSLVREFGASVISGSVQPR